MATVPNIDGIFKAEASRLLDDSRIKSIEFLIQWLRDQGYNANARDVRWLLEQNEQRALALKDLKNILKGKVR